MPVLDALQVRMSAGFFVRWLSPEFWGRESLHGFGHTGWTPNGRPGLRLTPPVCPAAAEHTRACSGHCPFDSQNPGSQPIRKKEADHARDSVRHRHRGRRPALRRCRPRHHHVQHDRERRRAGQALSHQGGRVKKFITEQPKLLDTKMIRQAHLDARRRKAQKQKL